MHRLKIATTTRRIHARAANETMMAARGSGEETETPRTEDLEAARERYAPMLDDASDATLIGSTRFVTYANRAAIALLGAASPDALAGRAIIEHVHADDRVRVAAHRAAVLSGARHDPVEHRLVRMDGVTVDVESVSWPAHFDGHTSLRTQLRNVSDRDARRMAHDANERRYQVFSEGAFDYMYELERVDEEHVRIAWATPTFVERTGIAIGSVYSLREPASTFQILDESSWRDFIDAVRHERPGRYERPRLQNGEVRWMRLVLRPYTVPHSARKTMLVAGRDATVERAAELALRDREIRIAAIADVAFDVIYEFALHADDSATIRWITRSGESTTGWADRTSMSRNEADAMVHPDDRVHRDERRTRLREGLVDRRQFRWSDGHNGWVWVDSIERPTGVLEDGALCVLGAVRDISAEKRVEAMQAELRSAREQLEARLLGELKLGVASRPPAASRLRGAPDRVLGASESTVAMRQHALLAAEHREPVLLTGETGTGKGHLAAWIHAHGARPDAPFVALNCSAMGGEIIVSELFGSSRGAFTSAVQDRKGLVEAADGGTLFLDEIGEMPQQAQATLLKVLEEKRFRRVGDTRVRHSDFRLVCATNRDLEDEVRDGRFRRDLLYRINVFPIRIPSLRERIDDLPELVREICNGMDAGDVIVPPETMRLLQVQHWPGNIRELRNALIRAILLARGKPLGPEHFPGLDEAASQRRSAASPSSMPIDEPVSDDPALRARLVALLARHRGNRSRVAAELSMSRTTLYRHLKRLDID